ncbi:conserved domain protein [Burkholderia pseudomallei 1710b]|nr:conserved domain protein [Burkholderia pseudomallei 1710b]
MNTDEYGRSDSFRFHCPLDAGRAVRAGERQGGACRHLHGAAARAVSRRVGRRMRDGGSLRASPSAAIARARHARRPAAVRVSRLDLRRRDGRLRGDSESVGERARARALCRACVQDARTRRLHMGLRARCTATRRGDRSRRPQRPAIRGLGDGRHRARRIRRRIGRRAASDDAHRRPVHHGLRDRGRDAARRRHRDGTRRHVAGAHRRQALRRASSVDAARHVAARRCPRVGRTRIARRCDGALGVDRDHAGGARRDERTVARRRRGRRERLRRKTVSDVGAPARRAVRDARARRRPRAVDARRALFAGMARPDPGGHRPHAADAGRLSHKEPMMLSVGNEDLDLTNRHNAEDWLPDRIRLRNVWLPLAHTFEIGERASRWYVHSEPCYLWRAAGRIHACPWHPGLPAAKRPTPRPRDADAACYPVVERFGYVWVWYGEPEAASDAFVPDVPFLPRDGGLPKYMQGNIRVDCCAPLLIENLLDLTHSDFLHAKVFGDQHADEDRVDVSYTSETVTMIRRCKNKSILPIMRWFGGVRAKYQDIHAVVHVHVRSSIALAYGRHTPGSDLPLFHPCVPESRNYCRLNFALNATQAPWPLRLLLPFVPYVVGLQDNSMVRRQSGRYLDAGERRDLYSRFDRAGLRYRILLQQLAKRQSEGDFSYADDALPSRDARGILGMPNE